MFIKKCKKSGYKMEILLCDFKIEYFSGRFYHYTLGWLRLEI